jgi:hypothetical protein
MLSVITPLPIFSLSSRDVFARDLLFECSMCGEKQIPHKSVRDDNMGYWGCDVEGPSLAGIIEHKVLKTPANAGVLLLITTHQS